MGNADGVQNAARTSGVGVKKKLLNKRLDNTAPPVGSPALLAVASPGALDSRAAEFVMPSSAASAEPLGSDLLGKLMGIHGRSMAEKRLEEEEEAIAKQEAAEDSAAAKEVEEKRVEESAKAASIAESAAQPELSPGLSASCDAEKDESQAIDIAEGPASVGEGTSDILGALVN